MYLSNQIASFLGLYNYYPKLIPHFAEITKILFKAVQNEQLEWAKSIDEAVRRLKQALTSERVV